MPKVVEVTLYQFDELNDEAKEKAREWWRECEAQDFGGHGELFEDTQEVAKLLGITFRLHEVPLMGGGKRWEPNIYWSLHTQGSGASFEADYSYAKGCVRKIKQYAPQDTDLHRIAQGLQDIQVRHGYGLTAHITQSGNYTHSYTMSFEVYGRDGNEVDADSEAGTLLPELMRDFADWIYDFLQKEWEYRMSDENVDESIRANDYTFRGNGKRSDG